VTTRPSEEILISDMKFEDGSLPELLDVLEIKFKRPNPKSCQTENHLIDDRFYWVKVGKFPLQKLPKLCEKPNPIWVNGFSSYNGINDRIPEDQGDLIKTSLILVIPKDLVIFVEPGFTKRKVMANFCVAGEFYKLTVTDLAVEQEFLSREYGQYSYNRRAVACISIGEPFKGYRYKLLASIIGL